MLRNFFRFIGKLFMGQYDEMGWEDLFHGLIKATFFGYLVAIIACWVGMSARGGAESVGKSTTNTVVYASVSILMADFMLTKFLMTVMG